LQAWVQSDGDDVPPRTGTAVGTAPTLTWRGVRVRVGIHSGLADPLQVAYNRASRRTQYTGVFADGAKRVADSAHGGQILLSEAAFSQLKAEDRAAGLIMMIGEYELGGQHKAAVPLYQVASRALAARLPCFPSLRAARTPLAGVLEVRHSPPWRPQLPRWLPARCSHRACSCCFKGLQRDRTVAGPATWPPHAAAVQHGVPRGQCRAACCRSRRRPCLRLQPAAAAGRCRLMLLLLQAPVGTASIVFMKATGVAMLTAWNSCITKAALALYHATVCELIPRYSGYIVEMAEELSLLAFQRPEAAIGWALAAQAALLAADWPRALLEHELCEPITTTMVAAAAVSQSSPAAPQR
jgi:class 3 adenylate cyclase